VNDPHKTTPGPGVMPEQMSPAALQALAADILRLSKLLTRDRSELPAAYLNDAALRKAYQTYFLPPNRAKVKLALTELSRHPQELLRKDRLRILDLGSGPGTAVLGTLDFFSQQDHRPFLEFTAQDQVAENLKEAARLFSNLQHGDDVVSTLTTIHSTIDKVESRLDGHYDIIMLSNLLNELYAHDAAKLSRRTELMAHLLGTFLTPDGSCILVEPALQGTSRDLLLVRDALREQGFTVYAPCLRQEPCPALLNPKDWCHEDIPWEAPPLIRTLDKLTGLRKDALKFSYLVLRLDGISLSDVYGAQAFRVVSEPLVSKGKAEYYVCGAAGRKLITRLDKDRSPKNQAYSGLRRGDIVAFDGLRDEGKRFKVEKGTRVIIRRGGSGRT
jgi:ribosomal protein RSM22 (predicted rRNA methylase)